MAEIHRDRFATPFERVVARRLRRAARDRRAEALESLEATAEVTSSIDPQRAVVAFARGDIRVHRHHPATVDLQLTTDGIDLSTFDPVEGEPAAMVAAVLEPPEITWQEAATAFWQTAGARAGLPRGLAITCLDDGATLVLGSTDGPDYEVAGSSEVLVDLFDGRRTLLELLYTRRAFFQGTLRQFSVLQGVAMDVMLDE